MRGLNSRGVESPRNDLGKNEKKGVLGYLMSKSKIIAANAMAVVAFGGGISEAKADQSSTNDTTSNGILVNNAAHRGLASANFSGPNKTFDINDLNNVNTVEVTPSYSMRYHFATSPLLEVLDVSGNVVKSYNFSDNISYLIPLGENQVGVMVGVKYYIVDLNDMSAPLPTELIGSDVPAKPIYEVVAPDGSKVGPAFRTANGDFYYNRNLKRVFPNPDPNVDQKMLSFEQITGVSFPESSAVDDNGDYHYVVADRSGANSTNPVFEHFINPETDEVVLPTPVITAPSEFSLNVNDLLSGKVLELNVSDVPENGSVKIVIDGNEFAFNETSAGVFAKTFTSQELMQIDGGEFDMIAEIIVVDADGGVLVSEDIDISVDVVAPNGIDFSIDGAHIENMGVSEISVIESEVIPVEVTLRWMDGALDGLASARVAVASVPLGLDTSMEDFAAMSKPDQVAYIKQFVDTSEMQEGDIALSGNLGQVKDIDVDATSVTVEIGEGGHVTAIFAIDEAGNLTVSIKGVDVRKIDNSDMTCEENPNQEKCAPIEESCDVNPNQEKCEVDPMDETCEENPAQEKCDVVDPETPVEPEQPIDKEEPETPEEDGDKDGSGDEEGGGCSTSGKGDAPVDGGLALGALGLLGMVGAGKRRKRKIVKRKK